MTTVTVKVDKNSQRKYRLHSKEIEFEELRRRILAAEGLQFLRAANRAAAQVGLTRMTSRDIDGEIKTARNGLRRR
jgi:hypothetical protein